MNLLNKYKSLLSQYFSNEKKVILASIFDEGRDALFAILSSLPLKEGDEILIQSYTCKSVVDVVLALNCTPIFIDIDDSYTIDTNAIEDSITVRTKVIISQNTYGIPPNIKRIEDICSSNNMYHIQDVSQGFNDFSLSSKSIAFGSSHWNKVFSTFRGGFTLIENKELHDEVSKRSNKLPKESMSIATLNVLINSLINRIKGTFLERYISSCIISLTNIFMNNRQVSFCNNTMDKFRLKKGIKEVTQLEDNLRHRSNISKRLFIFLREKGKTTPLKENISFTYFPIRSNNKALLKKLANQERILLYDWPLSYVSPIKKNLRTWNLENIKSPNSLERINDTVLVFTSPTMPKKYLSRILKFLEDNNFLLK